MVHSNQRTVHPTNYHTFEPARPEGSQRWQLLATLSQSSPPNTTDILSSQAQISCVDFSE